MTVNLNRNEPVFIAGFTQNHKGEYQINVSAQHNTPIDAINTAKYMLGEMQAHLANNHLHVAGSRVEIKIVPRSKAMPQYEAEGYGYEISDEYLKKQAELITKVNGSPELLASMSPAPKVTPSKEKENEPI